MSPSSIGVNLRVTGHCNQGGRKYMEDVFSVAYQQTEDEKDLEYAFFGIFDGHGGKEAALFAKEHLMDSITRQKGFWSKDDEQVLRAIREGFLSTQQAMWRDQRNWKPTSSGLPSTAGTTASVCFIKRGKIFIGHCGDSGILLGEEDEDDPDRWKARSLTIDHKPESELELERIKDAGGKVIVKSGVPRVVWQRPRGGHQGPVRRSTQIDEVPFLAVARSLGDLWSYNPKEDIFVVSPDPDLHVHSIDVLKDRCLILATDGAWNVLSPEMAVQTAHEIERNNEHHMIDPEGEGNTWINPSKRLVDKAIDRWNMCNLRADNTSIVTVMLDPPGPPRAQVLRRLHGMPPVPPPIPGRRPPALPPKPFPSTSSSSNTTSVAPSKGIAIISRFPNSSNQGEKQGTNLVGAEGDAEGAKRKGRSPIVNRIVHDSLKPVHKVKVTSSKTEAIINNLENLVSGSSKKSPSPPPLPARPAGLASRKAIIAAAAASGIGNSNRPVQQSRSPATKARDTSGGRQASAGAVASAVRSLSQHFAQHQTTQAPAARPAAKPVKQPRRSTVPEFVNGGCSSSDEENDPSANASAATRRTAGRTRRSAADVRRPDAAATATTTTSILRRPGRRSVPLGPSPSALLSASQAPSPARVLRPRNHDGVAAAAAATADLPDMSKPFLGGRQPAPSASSSSKRKRRSSRDLAADFAAAPGGKRRSCRPLPLPPPPPRVALKPPPQLPSPSNPSPSKTGSTSKRPRFLRSK